MKKLILPMVAVMFLLPQYSISQNFQDTNVLLVVSELKDSVVDHYFGTIKTLTSFELVQEDEDSGLKVEASFNQTETFDVQVYNTDGVTIFEEQFNTDELSLAMGFANLPAGKYFVSIVTKDGKIVKPLK